MAHTKDTREWKPYIPERGEWLLWKHDHHAIYTEFPDGERIDPNDIGLDFTLGIMVTGTKFDKCWRLQKDGETWVVEFYVAVQFAWNDINYCTTFSRSQFQWLWLWEELDEQDKRKPT